MSTVAEAWGAVLLMILIQIVACMAISCVLLRDKNTFFGLRAEKIALRSVAGENSSFFRASPWT